MNGYKGHKGRKWEREGEKREAFFGQFVCQFLLLFGVKAENIFRVPVQQQEEEQQQGMIVLFAIKKDFHCPSYVRFLW